MKPIDFSDFTLLQTMGHGGMATVYRAVRKRSGETVAIKIFKETEDRPLDVIRRLRDREVKMMVAIQHPNVVKFIEYGDWNDKYYYVMEFVELSLLNMIRKEELTLRQKVNLLYQTAQGLEAIHYQGIVHRDVKPGNILLSPSETSDGETAYAVKITDLGIAKNVSETDVVTTVASKRIPGTPKYLSPEQIELKPVDGRSDIFGLGVLAYELLAGEPPFEAATSDDYMKANVEQDPKLLHELAPDLPRFLTDLTAKMLSKDRELRYDSNTLVSDFALVEEHLDTGAPLQEHTNPNSIFYVPPPPTAAYQPARTPARGKAVKPVSWVAVAAIAFVASLLVFLNWPKLNVAALGKPAKLPERYSLPELSTEQKLARAEELQDDASQRWMAYHLLHDMDPTTLSEAEQGNRRQMLEQIESHLATQFVAHTRKLIEGGPAGTPKVQEAQANVERIGKLFPHHPQREELEARIEALIDRNKARYQFQAARAVASRLAREGHYERAIQEYVGYVDANKEQALKDLAARHVNDLLVSWAAELEKDGLTERKIDALVSEARKLQKQKWAEEVRDIGGRLYLQLAESLLEQGQKQEAGVLYRKIRREYPATDEAVTAGRRLERMEHTLSKEPLPQLNFARDLKVLGYKAAFWKADKAAGTRLKADQDSLTMHVKAEAKPARIEYAMVRFSRNAGFELKVPVQVTLEQGKHGDVGFQVGVAVEDNRANEVALYAVRDGYKYLLKPGEQFKGVSGLIHPFVIGPHAYRSYPLMIRYDSLEERLSLHVDGRERKTIRMTLGNFKIILFAQAEGEGAISAKFGKISCVPTE